MCAIIKLISFDKFCRPLSCLEVEMSYWASGYFDDDNNYVLPKTWSELPADFNLNPQAEKLLTANVDFDLFDRHIKKAEHKSREFFDWNRIKSYAKLAVDFYWQTLAAFNKDYVLDKINNLPQKFEGWQNLSSIASRLDEAEANLVTQFGKTNRDLNVQIDKIKNLQSAINYGGMAWMMYHLMHSRIPNAEFKGDLSNIIDSSLSVAQQNPIDDNEKLNYYNNLSTFKRNCESLIKPDFLYKKHNYVYSNINSAMLLDNILQTGGGLTCQQADSKMKEIFNNQREYFSADVGDILTFYNNRWLMLSNAKMLENCAKQWEECIVKNLTLFQKLTNGKNAFEQVECDRQTLLDLYYFAKDRFSKQITDDIVSVGKKLANSLSYAEKSYFEYQKEMDDAEQLVEMLKTRG